MPLHHRIMRQNWTFDIFGLITLCTLFYLFWIGHYPLFTPDEGRYSEVAREMVISGDYITPRVNGIVFLDKPILYYWLQAAAIHLFGIKEWALRFFPVLFGIFGIVTTYICGRHLFNRRTGLLSAIILATTPIYFGGAHYANLDLEVAVLVSSSLLFFITGVQNQTRHSTYFLLAAYVFSGLAFLTKGMIGVAFPGMIGFVWIALLNKWNLLKRIHLIPGILIILLIITPWYILVQQANPEFLHFFFVTQQITRFLSAGVFNNKTPFWFYAPVILIGFFPWTIFLFQALTKNLTEVWHKRHEHANQLFFLLWVGIIFLFFSIPHSKTVGYIIPIFPPLALLVGYYIDQLWAEATSEEVKTAQYSLIIMSILFTAFLAFFARYYEISPGFQPHMSAIAIIFIASAIAATVLVRKQRLNILYIICAASSVLFLLTLVLGATHLNQNSTKSIIEELKVVIKPNDEVITYFKYYHDIPLYLGRSVLVVNDWESPDIVNKDNWARELWFGKAFQNTDAWLINEKAFWEHWNSDKRIFVFLNTNYFAQFKLHVKSYYILGKNNDILLISNKPTVLARNNKHSNIFTQ